MDYFDNHGSIIGCHQTQVTAGKLAIVIDDIGYYKTEDNQVLVFPVRIFIAIFTRFFLR
ncbi:MAG: hypothetical protein ACTS84_03590 [Arsenophonus sp. NC-LC2-MAG3]